MKKPISIYVHIPFCLSKCLYCDFASFSGGTEDQQREYLGLLQREIGIFLKENPDFTKDHAVRTLFIGGGTPTALSDRDFSDLLSMLEETLALSAAEDLKEYTVEANPKTLTPAKVEAMKKFDITRISLGLQSSQPEELKALGRIHSFEDAAESVALLRSQGFSDINLDLMFAIPGQTLSSFTRSLEDALSLSPTHISAYSLILEEKTPLQQLQEQGRLLLPTEEEDLLMYEKATDFLQERGYSQYEISNFAKEGRQCLHNIVYWEAKEYISFGLSAHSHYRGRRYANSSSMEEYRSLLQKNRLPLVEEEVLTERMRFEERIFLGLRMNRGIFLPDLDRDFGVDFALIYREKLQALLRQELIHPDREHLRLTRKGFELSNYVIGELLS
ncbi:MAG: radical SAM family heme chaperone HemW [Peptostreptococcaceae bacterium]|nr:radical SAM family heme chaperone HemW [Peptostreptococcaceae bacterium]